MWSSSSFCEKRGVESDNAVKAFKWVVWGNVFSLFGDAQLLWGALNCKHIFSHEKIGIS